mgnify:FL=1
MIIKAVNFLKEARSELQKVVWPTREKAIRLTAIVIAIMVGVSLYLSFLDYGFSFGIKELVRK